MSGAESKACTKCGTVKPVSEFYPRYGYCKDCTKARTKAWREANRERDNALTRARRARQTTEQKEAERERQREWRHGSGREKYLARRKRHRERNKDKLAAEFKAYYEANRERLVEKTRLYWENNPGAKRKSRNPEKMRENGRKRRALELAAFREAVDETEVILRDEGRCGICGAIVGENPNDPLEFDHIVPLAAGGWHGPDNVQMSHRSCNRRKRDRQAA